MVARQLTKDVLAKPVVLLNRNFDLILSLVLRKDVKLVLATQAEVRKEVSSKDLALNRIFLLVVGHSDVREEKPQPGRNAEA